MHADGLANDSPAELYYPTTQFVNGTNSYIVRGSVNVTTLLASIRRAAAGVDPLVALSAVSTMDDAIGRTLAVPRFTMWLLSALGAIGLILALVGVYGVISYVVTQRTREVGIRIALGADGGGIQWMLIRQGLVLGVVGVTIRVGCVAGRDAIHRRADVRSDGARPADIWRGRRAARSRRGRRELDSRAARDADRSARGAPGQLKMKRLFRLPFSRDRMRRDVDAELSFHLEGRIEELIARGMSRAEAELDAARRFGNRELVEAEVEQIDQSTHQQQTRREWFGAIARDTRYAVRGLTRRPVYAAAVIITLALAIGANTTIFSVVEAVLLKPFDIPAIGKLTVVRDDFPKMNLRNASVSPLESIDLFARKDLFSVSAATSGDRATTEIRGENVAVTGAQTLGDFFTLIGARPLLGRLYRPEDSQPGRPQVVVLSYEFWQRLSGDSAIIGRSIVFGERSFEVIGVLPASIAYPRVAMYWRPMVLDPDAEYMKDRGYLTELFVGRMRDGLTLDRLRTELRSTANAWHAAAHGNYGQGGHTLIAQSFVDYQAGQLKPITVALFAAVTFVLLIACANVASLQLVRAAGRTREIAVRAALGAGRAAIARQVMVESALLAISGGIAGIALGWAGLRALSSLDLSRFPALKALHLDGGVLAFTAGTVAVAGVIFGSAPVFRAARADVNDGLRDAGRGSTGGAAHHRFLRASVVAQYALTLLLLTGAALTIESLDKLMRTDPGFVAENVVTFNATIPPHRYPTPDARYAFFSEVRDRLAAIPGVQAIGIAAGVPFAAGFGNTHYALPDIPEQDGEPQRHANQAFISGDYFKALGIKIVRGHAFTLDDYSSGHVSMIIDENLARQSFGSRDPIGARIEHGSDGIGTIVGVARAVKTLDLTEPAHPMVYHAAAESYFAGSTVIVRSTLGTEQIAKLSRAILIELEPKVIIGNPEGSHDIRVRVARSAPPGDRCDGRLCRALARARAARGVRGHELCGQPTNEGNRNSRGTRRTAQRSRGDGAARWRDARADRTRDRKCRVGRARKTRAVVAVWRRRLRSGRDRRKHRAARWNHRGGVLFPRPPRGPRRPRRYPQERIGYVLPASGFGLPPFVRLWDSQSQPCTGWGCPRMYWAELATRTVCIGFSVCRERHDTCPSSLA